MPETVVHAGIQRVLDAAARKGVSLDIHVFNASTHTGPIAATVTRERSASVRLSASPRDDAIENKCRH